MKILVTGGTGVVGAGLLPELLREGRQVRLLSRGANRKAPEFDGKIETFQADVADPAALRGAARDCAAVVHITGIVEERPPELTFDRVNVGGTRNVLQEAQNAGAPRFIYVSSLGADTGQSDYHRSKLAAEVLVKRYPGEWVILRPGNVFGPGDDVISMLLKMVRVLPAIPVIEGGDQPFQPIWFRDLGKALARAVDHPDAPGRILETAGAETTTTRELIDRLCAITGRSPRKVSLPAWLSELGVKAAEALGLAQAAGQSGVTPPINSAKLQMLLEGNTVHAPDGNALTNFFQLTPTPLQEGLTELADSLPELLPEDGYGALERKRYWALIRHSNFTSPELLEHFRNRITEMMPIEFAAEPGAPTVAEPGATLTGAIPGRGNFQVRVEESSPTQFSLVTLEGHPIAGMVSFSTAGDGADVRFEVEVFARPSNLLDWLALRTVGSPMQSQNWKEVVRRAVALSGGSAPEEVQTETETLSAEKTAEVERRVREIAQRTRARDLAAAS